MSKQLSMLTPATIRWQEATPVSASFDDFYFSTDSGLAESHYVFLEANRLPQRFTEAPLDKPFIIAETGFGSGLNFLCTWRAWREMDRPKRPLHFFSVEKFPLSINDLAAALSNWPELADYRQHLLARYPMLMKGLHCLEFELGDVRLNLLFEDVANISRYPFTADAWYLDGFSPRKNPEMWSAQVFREIAAHSRQGTTFSTFTAASEVRKALQQSGFATNKRVGFGVKREMLFGEYIGHLSDYRMANVWSLPAEEQQATVRADHTTINLQSTYDVAIIGAGLSGLTSAYELAQQGLRVIVLDSQPAPMQGASGQSQLAMYAKLPSEANKLLHFAVHALADSIRHYTTLQSRHEQTGPRFWHQTGLIQLAWNDKEARKQAQFLENIALPEDFIRKIDAQTATDLSGIDVSCGALWFEKAGWLDPQAYARCLVAHPNITCRYGFMAQDLEYDKHNRVWHITDNALQACISAGSVVIANANAARKFRQCDHLPTKPLRGQVTSIRHASLTATRTVLCGEGYLCPEHQQWHHFGATFDLKSAQPEIKDSDTRQNIETISKWLPGWLEESVIAQAEFEHSAGLRCTTPDYLPIVGPAPVAEEIISAFARLRVDANACDQQHGHYYPNLYLNIGHGSKGLYSTPLSAKLIRYYVCGGLPPCSEEHRVMLAPARFLIKHLSQRRI
jgi:tRNA 5-methylaminomethyl-2-thiouridine biosynthesis bifunctional protein